MKLSKCLSLVLCVALMLCSVNAFAVREVEVTDTLFMTDFNSDTPASAPKGVFKTGSDTTQTSALVSEADSAWNSNYLKLDATTDFRMWTPFSAPVSRGKICYEFDALMVNGYLQLSIVYSGKTVEKRWFFGSNPNGTMVGYPAEGAVPPSLSSKPPYYTSNSDNENLTYVLNEWQHFKFVIDVDNSSVKMYVNGKESNEITGFNYINTSNPIYGIGFRKSAVTGAGGGDVYLDNIKAYMQPTYSTTLAYDNCDSEYEGFATWHLLDPDGETASIIKKGDALSLNASDKTKVETKTPSDPDNNVIKIPNHSVAAYRIAECANTMLTVEFDFQPGNDAFAIVLQDAVNKKRGARMPFIMYRNRGCYANTDANNLDPSTLPTNSGLTEYTISGTNNLLDDVSYQWNHAKMALDLSTGDCVVTINEKTSKVLNIPYFAGMTVCEVVFRHYARTSTVNDQDAFIDNVKISCVSDGDSIKEVKSGSNKIKLIFKDEIDMETLTVDDITVTDSSKNELTVTDIKSSGKSVLAEIEEALTEDAEYTVKLADTVAYKDGYVIIETEQKFTYKAGSFAAVVTIPEGTALAGGTTANAKAVINTSDLTARTVDLYIASYNGTELVDVNYKTINIASITHGEVTEDISITLSKDVTDIKAFVWDENLAPYTVEAHIYR